MHGHISRINLVRSSEVCNPAQEVILEYALLQLVKNIQCEAREYVTVRKVSPEWLENWSISIAIKRARQFPFRLALQDLNRVSVAPQIPSGIVTHLLLIGQTFRTLILLCAQQEALLEIVRDVGR